MTSNLWKNSGRLALLVVAFEFAASTRAVAPPMALASPALVSAAQDSQPNQSPSKPEASTQNRNTDQLRMSKDTYAKAVAYARTAYTLYFVSVVWGIVVLWLVLKKKVAARLRDFAEARSRLYIGQAAIFVPALLLLLAVAELPLRIYWHWLSLRYRQSIQGWGSWIWDWTKGQFISIVLGLGATLLLLWLIRRKPRTWWFYAWLGAIPLVLGLVLITPWVLDPMFSTFRPLAEKHTDLVFSIELLTHRAGIPIAPERMFLMEASEKTNQINAYVTGLGASKRVVVWDNTIRKLAPDEVLFVVGHELGHYAMDHVAKGIAFGLVGILLALFNAYHALHWMLRRWGEAWGIRGQDDGAALAALLLIASITGFLAEPVGNWYSRRLEHAADLYGLEVIHGIVPNSTEAAAHSFQVMGESDLADPDPPRLITIWLYSHPPMAERLKFAHDYDPWSKGQAPKYVK